MQDAREQSIDTPGVASLKLTLLAVIVTLCFATEGAADSFSVTPAADIFLSVADSLPADSGATIPDDVSVSDSPAPDSAKAGAIVRTTLFPHSNIVGWTTKPVEDRKRQSPGAAMLKSAFVPGWGQLGNRKYFKAALVIGGETYLFLRWLDFRNQTVDARAAFESVEDDLTLRRQLFSEFDTVRDKRNFYAWLTGTLIFVSMIDAFVDAHLAKFPATEKEFSFQLTPPPSYSRYSRSVYALGANVTWRF